MRRTSITRRQFVAAGAAALAAAPGYLRSQEAPNRLNVATSRGRCLAVIVGSPELLKVRVHTPFQMRLANALCRFVEMAQVGGGGARPVPSALLRAPASTTQS